MIYVLYLFVVTKRQRENYDRQFLAETCHALSQSKRLKESDVALRPLLFREYCGIGGSLAIVFQDKGGHSCDLIHRQICKARYQCRVVLQNVIFICMLSVWSRWFRTLRYRQASSYSFHIICLAFRS